MHTFTAVYLHVVFATWNRVPFLDPDIRPRIHAYFAGTARNLGLEYVTVGGVADHLHFLARFIASEPISNVIGQLKQSSTCFVHDEVRRLSDFKWQRGFAAFSVGRDRVASVVRYIEQQQEHHRRKTFEEELDEFLREFGASADSVGLM